MENDKHCSAMYPLDSNTETLINLETPAILRKGLRQILMEISSISHCPNCGGLLPEISFEYNGLTYYFTCYKIEREGKVIAETDYSKFGKYCGKL